MKPPPEQASDIVAELRRRAESMGFTAFGVAPPAPPRRSFGLREWLDAGFAGSMAPWLGRNVEDRQDPRRRFPWVTSVLVFAMSYHHPAPDAPPESLVHWVARYARGRDYHRVLLKRVKAFCREARDDLAPGVRFRPYVDTGPVMEREYFAMAGLGWIGKHTLAMNRRGSWFLLGVALTDWELPLPLEVHPDLCGSCTRCLDACPTDAFDGPYRLDARKCISYQTIENRAPEIPEEVGSQMEPWLFGCDICQEVCPWNRKAPLDGEDAFLPREAALSTSVDDLESMDEAAFNERFAGSPLRRAKLSGLRRNLRTLLHWRGYRQSKR